MKKFSLPGPASKKTESQWSIREKLSGLCSCCTAFHTCTYPRSLKRPILQCEEFNGILPPPLKPVPQGKVVPATTKRPRLQIKNSGKRRQGLCSICEDRATCAYPKPEGGVWHCEDYR